MKPRGCGRCQVSGQLRGLVRCAKPAGTTLQGLHGHIDAAARCQDKSRATGLQHRPERRFSSCLAKSPAVMGRGVSGRGSFWTVAGLKFVKECR